MPDFSLSLLYWPLLLVGAYVVGSIPFAQVVAKAHGVDLREVGSGNVGAGNLSKQVGMFWGIVAGVFDGLKGLIPVWLLRHAGLGVGAAGLAGVAAVIGHNWSLFMRGRSGRGLATSVGIVVALDPVLLVWTTGWSVAGWKIGSGLGGFLGWGLLPIVAASLGRPPTETLVLLLLTILLMARRMQGNAGAEGGVTALRRVIYDNDHGDNGYPDTIEDPLSP